MKKHVEKFQYLTRDLPTLSHVSQARLACESGAKWLQYRCVSKSDAELLEDIKHIADICDDWGCSLLVTNHIHLAAEADIQGFHIEDMEVDIAVVRQTLGDAYIIGASANSFQKVMQHTNAGADYVSFGPYKHTFTKNYSGPLVGLEGYQNILERCALENAHVSLFAVGGIQLDDVEPLLTIGVSGIAVSGAIYSSVDFGETYRSFHQKVY